MFKRQNILIFEYAKILLFSMIVFASTGIATASAANQPPIPVNPGGQTTVEGENFILQLIATDPEGDVIFYGVSNLPDNIRFNQSTGLISGVSNKGTAGTYEIVYSVWNDGVEGQGDINEVSFTLQVNPNQPPVPVNPGDQTTVEGENFILQLIATDPEGDVIFYGVSNLPDNIRFNQSTGLISGVSNKGTAGTYEIVYSVWNDGVEGQGDINEVSFTLQVNPNQPPIPVNPGDQTTIEGQYFTLQLIATDPEGDNINYSAGPFPDGVSFNESTGLISGVSDEGTAGAYEVRYQVWNDNPQSQDDVNEVSFIVRVNAYLGDNRAPLVTDPGTQHAKEGDLVNLPIIATDPDGDNLSFTATGLPDGLTINSTSGLISGFIAFDTVNNYTVEVVATDDGAPSQSAAVQFSMPVSAAGINQPPSIGQIPDQSAKEGDLVNLLIIATDPDGDNLSFKANGLPDGLTIDSTSGVISGTVATGTAGIYAIEILVDDDGSPDSKQARMVFAARIYAAEPNQSPSVENPGNQSASKGDAVTLAIIATDPDGDNLRYAANNLPNGLSINSATGLISGTVNNSAMATNYVQVVVRDDATPAESSSIDFTWNISDGGAIPPTNPTNPTNVPTLSEWSMILLTLLLMGFGMVSTRTKPRKHK